MSNTTLEIIKEELSKSETMTVAYIQKLESENAWIKNKLCLFEFKEYLKELPKDAKPTVYKDFKKKYIEDLDKFLEGKG